MIRNLFRRKPQPTQGELAFATTDELVTELRNRSRSCVVVHRPLIGGGWQLFAGGADGNVDRFELLGMCDLARSEIRRALRSQE